jgi:hypothetical protein
VKQAEALLREHSYKTLQPAAFDDMLAARATVFALLADHYTLTPSLAQPPMQPHPLHRKLRLSAKIKDEQSVRRLVKNLRQKFGEDAVLVIGDWSSNNARFHQPSKGIGMRRQLRKAGFRVYLLHEAYTSSICPACEQRSVAPFSQHLNPRPWRRHEQLHVTVHGLLRCATETCVAITRNGEERRRLWNRDMLSVLNYKAIIDGQYEHGERPSRFTRAHWTNAADAN